MSTSTELQVLLFLCLIIRLTVSMTDCGTNNSLTSQPSYNVSCTFHTTNTNKYTLELEYPGSPNYDFGAEQLMICDEAFTYCIELLTKSGNDRNETKCENSESGFPNATNETCKLNSTNWTTTTCMKDDSNVSIQTIALITLCCVLTVLLVMVTTCWIYTYWKMKRRIRALETTPVNYSSTTEDSNYKTQLGFQNFSYERNSTSYSQSAIYDLPFQTTASATKNEKPNDTEARERHDSNRYKTVEENMSHAHIVPQIPRANEIEHSGDDLQMVCGVTAYEVPVPLKRTKPSLYDST